MPRCQYPENVTMKESVEASKDMYARISRRWNMRRIVIVILFFVLLGPLTISYSASEIVKPNSLVLKGQALLGYCSVVSTSPDGRYVYAAFGSSVAVLDVQDPSNPKEMGRTYIPNCFDGKTAVWNNRFFVPRDIYGLGAFDVSNPANPSHVTTYRDRDLKENENEYSGGVEVVDGYAYWANGHNGLTILNASTMEKEGGYVNKPKPGCAGGTEPSTPLDFAMGVHVIGNLAYLCTRNTGVYIIDVTDKRNPSFKKNIPGGFAIDMTASDSYGFVANGTYGIKVIDLSTNEVVYSGLIHDKHNPNEKYDPKTEHACFYRSVVLLGNVLYAASANFGVDVIDVSNPSDPYFITNRPAIDESNPTNELILSSQLALYGNHLYVANCLGGLKIYSLTDPRNPTITPTIYHPFDQARDVAVLTGNIGGKEVPRYAYIAYGNKGLAIVDVNDPAAPSKEKIIDINGSSKDVYTEAVAVNNNKLYAADGIAGLKVFNLSDPMNPQLIWQNSILTIGFQPKNILDVQVLDNIAYLADSDSNSLWILDMNGVGNSGFQPSVKYKNGIGYARKVFKHGDYVYVASKGSGCSGPNGLYVIKLDQSLEPVGDVITLTEGLGQITDVDAADVNGKPYVFVTTDGGATGSSYLHILEHKVAEASFKEASSIEFEKEGIADYLPAVEVSGTNAYIDHTNKGIFVYDISNPSIPVEKGYYKLTCNNNSHEIHLFAGLIFDAHGDSGLYIFNDVDGS
jgi:hypothetical protein